MEGEYRNGERNGKGKEYSKFGVLKYEGEYLYDRKQNGKGYDENGNVIYEIINGNGKGAEYNDSRTLIFEGEFSNGKRNGKGKEYLQDGKVLYEGEYIDGKRKMI